MGKNPIETLMGAVVIAVAAIFMLFAYSKADIGPVDGYKVKAKFLCMDGLKVGGDVRLGGHKVGTIIDEVLDPNTYFVVVTLSVDRKIKLPTAFRWHPRL